MWNSQTYMDTLAEEVTTSSIAASDWRTKADREYEKARKQRKRADKAERRLDALLALVALVAKGGA